MPQVAPIIMAAAAVIGTGATVYSTVEAGKAREEARQQQKAQEEKQNQLLAEEQNRQKTEAAQADAIQKNEMSIQARSAGIGGPDRRNLMGRQGTILTSPLGVTGQAALAPKKTILGA